MKIFLYLFLLCPIFIFGQPLSNIQRGTATKQIAATDGPFNTLVYRNAIPYILDSLGIRDSILMDLPEGVTLDSLVFSDSLRLYTSQGVFTTFISSMDSTIVSAGFGISVSELSNNFTISADSSVLATQYDLTLIGGGMDSTYNGNRVVSRVPTVGVNLGATTFRQWLDWWYIANATAPTLSMNAISPTLVEVGTSNNYTLSGSLTNPCTYTITSRDVDGNSWFGTSYSQAVTFAPTSVTSKTYTATAGWNDTGTICAPGAASGTASASRSTQSVFPVLWGMSATSYTGGSVPYNIWSKRITTEGNQTGLTMTGTNMFMYILIPKSWSDFTVLSIIDHNGFNVTPSFTAYDVSVTSTGLVNNWTQNYKLYKLNTLTTASGFNYIYNR